MMKKIAVNNTKRYEAYKDSGVKWLGEIPEHWEVKKLKLSIKKTIDNRGRTPLFGDTGVPMLEIGNITNGLKYPTEDFQKYVLPEIVVKYERDKVEVDDVLISTVGATSGKVVIIKNKPNYFIAQNVIGLRFSENFNAMFMYFFLKSEYFITSLQLINKGNTIDNLKVSVFVNNICFFPPLQEQIKIAQFLDDKTTKIDEAIAIKEQQIQLLKERKKILIHKAVTQGLNPNVTLKDSGVEWIGEIPEGWEVKRLKFTSKLVSEKVSSKESLLEYIGMENIESWTGKYISSDSETDGLANYFNKGDILFGKLRPYLAKVYLAEKEGICSTEFLVYRTSELIYNWYLNLIMLSFEFVKLIDSSTYGSKMPRANSDFIGNQVIPIPPLSEQKEISAYIEASSQKIETAISLKQQEIDKLKEYKSSLINGVVTGKVKVS